MTSKTLYLFLDAMTCALGGILVIFFSEMNQAQVSVQQMQGKLDQHHADIQMVAQLQDQRDAAVEVSNRLASEVERYETSNRRIKDLNDIFITDNRRLRGDLIDANDKNKQQAGELEDIQKRVAQITGDNQVIAAENKAIEGQQRAVERRVADLESENKRLAGKNAALGKLQQTQAREVIGLKGEFKNVVFVIDTSESMEADFNSTKSLIAIWVKRLDFKQFNLITFSDAAEIWRTTWYDSGGTPRELASVYINNLKAEGKTATKEALSNALQQHGVDTIVFFSDGNPSDGEHQEILDHLRTANRQGVVINVVALGAYFNAEYGAFLKQLAADHGGEFIGR